MNFLKKWFGSEKQKECCNVKIEEVKETEKGIEPSCCREQRQESIKEGEEK
ncbi:hypothetical protein [Metabacillus mangrovi]|uniref:hypothetical protein n=1 Tax=Metabacillus mangrovi TaxID=1491830 RepID=UPI0013DDD20A|nr:hypothetical protein [Metabacillus mangrovi]